MTEEFCNCDQWKFYVKNYDETFHWYDKPKKWYILWVHLANQNGFTQVSRYSIPISYCPLCGKKLTLPKEN